VPKGWEVTTLGKVLKTKKNSVKLEDMDADTAYVGLEHMPRRSLNLADWGNAEDLKSNKNGFTRGDILFGKLRPYFHKVAVAPTNGVCSTDILVLGPKSTPWFGYVFCHCFSDPLIAHTTALSNGAKMPRTKWKDLNEYPVVLPPEKLAAAFDERDERLQPLTDRILANIHQSRTLATLRDTLLPKLLSGELSTDSLAV